MMQMDDACKEWCIQRCTEVSTHDNSTINGIMLRFRPIAPKPATGDSVSGDILTENKNPIISTKRTKRKYVRVRKNSQRRKRKNRTPDEERNDDEVDKTVITLQLLPEKPNGMDSPAGRSWFDHDQNTMNVRDSTTWLNFVAPVHDDDSTGGFRLIESDRTAVVVPRVRVVESWVTVESVTDTCMEGAGLGSTDSERRMNLEVDTCPGFISNGHNTVEWVNEAYRRMIKRQGGEAGQTQTTTTTTTTTTEEEDQQEMQQILVWLVLKERLPYFLYHAFTCRVRLQYTCGDKKGSLILPCDTWRMDCGGFAWRLDVKAALSLGRLSSWF